MLEVAHTSGDGPRGGSGLGLAGLALAVGLVLLVSTVEPGPRAPPQPPPSNGHKPPTDDGTDPVLPDPVAPDPPTEPGNGSPPAPGSGDPPILPPDEGPGDGGQDPGASTYTPVPPLGEQIAFGMDAASIEAQRAAGFEPDLGTLWVGPWTLEHGWREPDALLEQMAAENITPAVHVYYWGDDLTPGCLEQGCWSSLHGVHKDAAGWQRLIDETVAHLEATLDGKPALVLLESEFNKASVARYEPLDAALAEKTREIQEAYPPAKVVLSLGNWNREAWSTWDRAASAADAVGIQAMRASTRDTLSSQLGLYNATLQGAQVLDALFDAPIVLQDISISSYPEPEYLDVQARALARLFVGLDTLQGYGVTTMIYRAWFDNPDKSTANYFGMAERHWGLVSLPDREPKPAASIWLQGVAMERADTEHPTPSG